MHVVRRCWFALVVFAVVSCGGSSSTPEVVGDSDFDAIGEQNLVVDATSNIYLADLSVIPVLDSGAGQKPPSISISSLPGQILTVTNASGTVSCCTSRAATTEPDGRESPGGVRIDAFMGLSGITYLRRGMFLTAVFTNERDENATPPETLDFTTFDPNSVVEYFPEIDQVFFVGDGRTSDGTIQSFYVPEGARHVHFGLVDGSNFAGTSSHFDDNSGAFRITARIE